MKRNYKKHYRAKAIKKYKKVFPKANKDELKAFATGFNMGFDIVFDEYKKVKQRLNKLQ